MNYVWEASDDIHTLRIGGITEPVATVILDRKGELSQYQISSSLPGASRNTEHWPLERAKKNAEHCVASWFLTALQIIPD